MNYSKWDNIADSDSDSDSKSLRKSTDKETKVFKLKLIADEEFQNNNFANSLSHYQDILHQISPQSFTYNTSDLLVLHHPSRIYLSSLLNSSCCQLKLNLHNESFLKSKEVLDILDNLFSFNFHNLNNIPHFFIVTRFRSIQFLFASILAAPSKMTLADIKTATCFADEFENLINLCSDLDGHFEGVEFNFDKENKKEHMTTLSQIRKLESDLEQVKEKKSSYLFKNDFNDVIRLYCKNDFTTSLTKLQDMMLRDELLTNRYLVVLHYLSILNQLELIRKDEDQQQSHFRLSIRENFQIILRKTKILMKDLDQRDCPDYFIILCQSIKALMSSKCIQNIATDSLDEIYELVSFFQKEYLFVSLSEFQNQYKTDTYILDTFEDDFYFLFLSDAVFFSKEESQELQTILGEKFHSLFDQSFLLSPFFVMKSFFNRALNLLFLIDSFFLNLFKIERNWTECRDLLKYIIRLSYILISILDVCISRLRVRLDPQIISKLETLKFLLHKKISHYLSRLSNVYKVIQTTPSTSEPSVKLLVTETYFTSLNSFMSSEDLDVCLSHQGSEKKCIGIIQCMEEAAKHLDLANLDSTESWRTCGEYFNVYYKIAPYAKILNIPHDIAEWGYRIWSNYEKSLRTKEKRTLQTDSSAHTQLNMDRLMAYYNSSLAICAGGNIEEFNSLGELALLYSVTLIKEMCILLNNQSPHFDISKLPCTPDLLYIFFDIHYHLSKLLLQRKKVLDAFDELELSLKYIDVVHKKDKKSLNDPSKKDLRERYRRYHQLKALILCAQNSFDDALIELQKLEALIVLPLESEDADVAYIRDLINSKNSLKYESPIKVSANLPREEYKKILLQKEEEREQYFLNEQRELQKKRMIQALEDKKLSNRIKKFFYLEEGILDWNLIFSLTTLFLFSMLVLKLISFFAFD